LQLCERCNTITETTVDGQFSVTLLILLQRGLTEVTRVPFIIIITVDVNEDNNQTGTVGGASMKGS